MKILVITNLYPPEFLGGYELGCSHVVDALTEAGHDVRVLTSRTSGVPRDPQIIRSLELAPIYNVPLNEALPSAVLQHWHIKSAWLNHGNVQLVADALEGFEPDVVYLWNLLGLGGLAILALLRQLGTPWVWHIMDMIPRQLCGLGGDAIPGIAAGFSEHVDGTYIVCSTRVHREILAGGADLGSRVHLLPNWIAHDGNPRRDQFYPGGTIKLMHAVGVFGRHKGTDIVIEAAAKLLEQGYAAFSIDMYGHPPSSDMVALLHKHDVTGLVNFLGPRDQASLYELYPQYDLFLFPTWDREPFGFAPLEAASFGCVPLIPYDCGISEWLVDGVHCLKTARDADSLAQRVIEVIRGEIAVEPIGRRAEWTIRDDFHLAHIAPKIETILSNAVAEGATRRGSLDDFHRLLRLADGLVPTLVAEAS